MQRHDRQSCGAIRVNEVARIEHLGNLMRELLELKNLNFGGYSCRVNQSGACSSSDVITSGGRKSETTMEDKLIVVVCGYPELYDTTSYFYKNRNKGESHFSILPLPLRLTPSPCSSKPSGKR